MLASLLPLMSFFSFSLTSILSSSHLFSHFHSDVDRLFT